MIDLTDLPDTPIEAGLDGNYYFYASGRFYYFDDRQKLYSREGDFLYDASPASQEYHGHTLKFDIDGVYYWFGHKPNVLWSQGSDGKDYRVHTWQNDSEAIGSHMSMPEMFHHLLNHGCVDLSLQMDAQQDRARIKNGGGFGDIWMGELKDRTRVAIKAWREPNIQQCNYKMLKRAAREIYFWSKLKHENIHPLMGVVMFKGHYLGMVSHWMDNGNLYEYMRKNPQVDRYQMSVQVASGLAYMHQCDAVHGDVKACNVLVSSDGVAMLSDFGLSTMSEAGLVFSETTNTARSLRWAAPELLSEVSRSSKASDVYALGMTVLEIFTGTVPYSQCQRDFQILLNLQQGIFPTRPIDRFKDDARGNQIWELLECCWKQEPAERPEAKEVLESLTTVSCMETETCQLFGDMEPDRDDRARELYHSTKARISRAPDAGGSTNVERLQHSSSFKQEFPDSSTWAENGWRESLSKRSENKPFQLTLANTDSDMKDDIIMHDDSFDMDLDDHHAPNLGEKQKRDNIQISGSEDQAKNLSASVREREGDGLAPVAVPRASTRIIPRISEDSSSTTSAPNEGPSTRKVDTKVFNFDVNSDSLQNGKQAGTLPAPLASGHTQFQGPPAATVRVVSSEQDENDEGASIAGEDIYLFFSHGAFYYIDTYGNVYYHDGTLACATPSHTDPDGHTAFSFNIGQLLYLFSTEGLWSLDAADNFYPVQLYRPGGLSKVDPKDGKGQDGAEKAGGGRYYFLSGGALYYIDNYRNVYYEDGSLLHDGALDMESDGHPLTFYIDGVPYHFDTDGLFSYDTDGDIHPFQLWPSLNAATLGEKGRRDNYESAYPDGLVELGVTNRLRETRPIRRNKKFFCASNRLYYFDEQKRLYSHDSKLIGSVPSSTKADRAGIPRLQIDGVPYWFEDDVLFTRGADGKLDRVFTWSNESGPVESDSCPPNVEPSPLTHTHVGQSRMMLSSALLNSQSPSNIIDRRNNEEPPLFAVTEPSNTISIPTIPSKPTTNKTPGAPSSARPLKKRGGKGHKTCVVCGKVLSGPAALKDHINSHYGAKPHVCPFEGCNTGFAARQNMRRHFDTHKVGKIEDYEPPERAAKQPRVEEPTVPNSERTELEELIALSLPEDHDAHLAELMELFSQSRSQGPMVIV